MSELRKRILIDFLLIYLITADNNKILYQQWYIQSDKQLSKTIRMAEQYNQFNMVGQLIRRL